MNIPKFAISNYPLTLTVFVLLLILGIGSFLSMPQREDPKLDVAEMMVIAVYPGETTPCSS